MRSLWDNLDRRLERRSPLWRKAVCAALVLMITGLQWLEVDLSPCTSLSVLLSRKWMYPLINLGLMAAIDALFLLLTRRWGLAYALGSIFCCVWALVDFHVWYYNHDLFTPAALRSVGTALNVLGGYRIVLSRETALILAGTAVDLAASAALGHLAGGPIPWKRMGFAALGLAVLLCADAGALVLMDRFASRDDWQPRIDADRYGYPIYFVRQVKSLFHTSIQPEGYDTRILDELAAALPAAEDGTAAGDEQRPDIILILNETYYFPEDYLELDADVPYHENYDSLAHAVKGRTVVPWVGSSTNRTEYELFTGNTMALVACQAPYTSIELAGANNIVRYLKHFGYTAVAMHDSDPSNYNRHLAFPQLGFDEVHFQEDFTPSAYGSRPSTDESNFRDMFRWYEQSGDGPRFMYLLTYQNHGGWEQNDASLDQVHVRQDLGDQTDDIEEYLTSIRMTDDAIDTLITYFSAVDRPVLVCMLGDHTAEPVMNSPAREGMTDQEAEVILRSTPFFIWANDAFGPLQDQDGQVITVPRLMPTLLQIAGIPLSPYYQTIIDIGRQVPVLLMTGLYRTAEGEYGTYSTEDALYPLLSPYYYMSYNNMQRASERRQVLFDPPA